jgi:hypothetical protein
MRGSWKPSQVWDLPAAPVGNRRFQDAALFPVPGFCVAGLSLRSAEEEDRQ